MSDAAWLAIAFGAVAVGIGGYIASLLARRRRLERRKEELTRR